MKTQHQVVLSLGSNQGNRLENIENCLQLIHHQVGTIIKVSKVYETPAWGFESDAFYNCTLLIHSNKEAQQILTEVLAIENQLGRVRAENQGYQSRCIDIDIITFDQEIIATDALQIPHPLMQNRKFVLLPMLDLNLDWIHPVFHTTISALLESTQDQSSCVVVHGLENPLKKNALNQFRFIAFEGNIGVGKTTLTTKIAEDFNAKIVSERFADNPFLSQFYENQKQYAFSLEVSFLVDRYKQLTDDLEKSFSNKEFVVADYAVFKSLIFAKITLDEQEFQLYQSLFDIVFKEVPKPDLYVYLYQSQERLLANIQKRGRVYEENISLDYLEKINTGYRDFIQSKAQNNIVFVDVSALDFVKNQSDYIFVLNEINKGIINFNKS